MISTKDTHEYIGSKHAEQAVIYKITDSRIGVAAPTVCGCLLLCEFSFSRLVSGRCFPLLANSKKIIVDMTGRINIKDFAP
jgi:hypothetical protein